MDNTAPWIRTRTDSVSGSLWHRPGLNFSSVNGYGAHQGDTEWHGHRWGKASGNLRGSRWGPGTLGSRAEDAQDLGAGTWGTAEKGSSQGQRLPAAALPPRSARTSSSSSSESVSGSTCTSSSSPMVRMKPSSESMVPRQPLPESSAARQPPRTLPRPSRRHCKRADVTSPRRPPPPAPAQTLGARMRALRDKTKTR